MCFTNPICIFFIFGVIISDCKFLKFITRIKLQTIAYKTSKKCLREWGDGKGRVGAWGVDVTLGEERHGCWGIDAPGNIGLLMQQNA